MRFAFWEMRRVGWGGRTADTDEKINIFVFAESI